MFVSLRKQVRGSKDASALKPEPVSGWRMPRHQNSPSPAHKRCENLGGSCLLPAVLVSPAWRRAQFIPFKRRASTFIKHRKSSVASTPKIHEKLHHQWHAEHTLRVPFSLTMTLLASCTELCKWSITLDEFSQWLLLLFTHGRRSKGMNRLSHAYRHYVSFLWLFFISNQNHSDSIS
jgi:hypothetical protein